MKANFALGRVAFCGITAAVFAFACSSDKSSGGSDAGFDSSTPGSGGKGGTGGSSTGGKSSGGASSGGAAGAGATGAGGKVSAEAGVTDGGDAGVVAQSLCGGLAGADQIKCGEYIVTALDACGDCHTPRTAMGAPDTTKILAGNPSFADISGDPADGIGNIPTPNLTQLKTSGWTAQDIKDAILDGKRSVAHGGGIFPIMPYTTLHNMAADDASAIAAYLLSLTPIVNVIPAREPLPGDPATSKLLPVAVVDAADIPNPVIDKSDPSYADAMLGKYLAGQVGPCIDCHTSRKSGTPLPDSIIDMSRPFGGGEPFMLGMPFGTVISANITPDPTAGLKNWTPGLIKTLLKTGKNDKGDSICPPMPVGPMGAFGGLTDAHALAIGAYITHLPPVSNGADAGGPFPLCLLPPPPKTDAGPLDSGTD